MACSHTWRPGVRRSLPVWYWYVLAMESLILDRWAGSVRLEAPSTKVASVRASPSSRGGGRDESNRTSATGPPQPSDAPAFPIPRRSFGQDRTFYRGAERLAWGLLLCFVGSAAGGHAHRGDSPHACGSDREFCPGNALYCPSGLRVQRDLWRWPHRLRRGNREVLSGSAIGQVGKMKVSG